jgi:hypothetical protein
MEELLIVIVQFLFEFILDVLLNIPFDWPSRNRDSFEPESIWATCFLWFLGASFLGWLSLFFFEHTWIAYPGLRIANLVVAPIVSGAISQAIAIRRAQRNPYLVPRNHFWQAYWFTLGFTLVRFAYATHI